MQTRKFTTPPPLIEIIVGFIINIAGLERRRLMNHGYTLASSEASTCSIKPRQPRPCLYIGVISGWGYTRDKSGYIGAILEIMEQKLAAITMG